MSPEPERKNFLDKLFDYMQKKGTYSMDMLALCPFTRNMHFLCMKANQVILSSPGFSCATESLDLWSALV